MEIKKYKVFLSYRTDDEKSELQTLVLNSLEKNDERVLAVTKFIVITLFVYFLFKFNLVDELQLFGLSIRSSKMLFSVMPSILSISYFLYMNIQFRKQELKYLLDTQLKNKYKISTKKPLDLHWITKLLTPLEFNQTIYSFKGKLSFINIPMYLVFLGIYLIPFWILWDGISLLLKFDSKTLYDYFLIATPAVVSSYTLLFFVYIIWIGIKDQVDGMDNINTP